MKGSSSGTIFTLAFFPRHALLCGDTWGRPAERKPSCNYSSFGPGLPPLTHPYQLLFGPSDQWWTGWPSCRRSCTLRKKMMAFGRVRAAIENHMLMRGWRSYGKLYEYCHVPRHELSFCLVLSLCTSARFYTLANTFLLSSPLLSFAGLVTV